MRRHLIVLALILSPAGCDGTAAAVDATSCWDLTCPSDPGASTCGRCDTWAHDQQCPPGFVCNCATECVRGPRTPDGGVYCTVDAMPPDVDAGVFDWSGCDIGDPSNANLRP
ncbi:MAG: hypothetical protein H6709_16230 [Kofleriaceae bacterium]|nr:hypothetical protein [Myxococcales bacterium]MCB9563189.1 hypothetical protein [Kofleriaceae bacterium]MCB9573628.1 hypothetical protein [Kofleriaceae bacterium]